MKDQNKTTQRLGLEIPKEIHSDIKVRASTRGISITKYVMRAIMEQIKKDKSYE